MTPEIRIKPNKLKLDTSRVIAKPFIPAHPARIRRQIDNVLKLSDSDVEKHLNDVLHSYAGRHRNFEGILEKHFDMIKDYVPNSEELSRARKLFLGSYFTQEYSVESAALFNPSIVPHPDQTGVAEGDLKFIMSLRATGEGHISSIEFRSGLIDQKGIVSFDEMTRFLETPKLSTTNYQKTIFAAQAVDAGLSSTVVSSYLAGLGDTFTRADLAKALQDKPVNSASDTLTSLMLSNYDIEFSHENSISERVIFQSSPDESGGIEDARFVRFTNEDGSATYYATYTAYNKPTIRQKLIQTNDFRSFSVRTLHGSAVENKGFALFPRKINGQFVMLSRQDNENNFIMASDNLYKWDEARLLKTPEHYWEFVQVGNCGSPLETSAGWLVITHGVGPMRQYNIGAFLLDLEDPSKVIATLPEPLLVPRSEEREGYVPNVVYSCGAIIDKSKLVVMPYAASDQSCLIAEVPLADILGAMKYKVDPKAENLFPVHGATLTSKKHHRNHKAKELKLAN